VTNTTDSAKPLSVLRTYLRGRSSKPGRGFWGPLFGRALSYEFAQRALKTGASAVPV